MADLVLARPGASSNAELHWSRALPLGIAYLAASARQAGIDVAVVDGKSIGHASVDETVTQIRTHHPSVVGVSSLTAEFGSTMEICARLKEGDRSIVTVLGGAHANALPVESLAAAGCLDYVIAGEAEDSLVKLVQDQAAARQPGPITGLYSRGVNGSIVADLAPAYDHDISQLPFPAWDLFPRSDVYPVMTERGCPYACVFCSKNMSRIVRSRSVSHVMEEIAWLDRDYSPKAIYFEDETFGINAERTYELLEHLSEFNRARHICFKAQTRVDRLTTCMAQMMKRAGFEYVELGIESGDPAILDNARKGFAPEHVEMAVSALHSAGIKTWLNFIIGLPGETTQSVRKSINLAARLNPNRLSVAIIVAYPGSEIFHWAIRGEHGYRLLTRDWTQFDKYLSSSVELQGLSYRTMRRLQLQMYAETYIRNGRMRDLFHLFWRSRSFLRPVVRSILGTKSAPETR